MAKEKEANASPELDLLLRRIGLNEKESAVYLTLLELGPAPVRTIAVKSGINRGTTYEMLKALIDRGLVSYFSKTRHQYFAAEDPRKLQAILELRSQELEQTRDRLNQLLPQLQAKMGNANDRPKVRFFEGTRGIRTMLEDVLDTMAAQAVKEYRVYSFADVREHLYTGFRDFVERRIKLGIRVRTIAIGSGGKLWGLDERRWLPDKDDALTYQILYAGKFAMISLTEHGEPIGALVEDERIARTQQLIFDHLWNALGSGAAAPDQSLPSRSATIRS